jgi:gliding motility-associated-like protein
MWKPACCIFLIVFFKASLFAQTCVNVGQTPESAFPVCGNETYFQNTVPICGNTNIPVNCIDPALYQNKNPFWYKISCYVTGTIGFVITPNDASDDYDWQLFDATGHNPSDVFTDPSMFVSCNWSGEPGETGSSGGGTSLVVCAGFGQNTFSSMATIYAGHEYLLLVSHFTNSQSGYQLLFIGGSAVIIDPLLPALASLRTSCDGASVIVKLNKKIKCNSIAPDGSDFIINYGPAITGAFSAACGSHFDTDSVVLTLSNPLSFGIFNLAVQDGTDGNTLLDNCNRPISPGNNMVLSVAPTTATLLDSIEPFPCGANHLKLVFKRPIRCNSIAVDGSDFTITGPQPVNVNGISTSCNATNTSTYTITLNLSTPLLTGGTYQVHLQNGSDGNTIIDECGNVTPPGLLSFTVYPKPSANFNFINHAGCRNDTLNFVHDGNNGVTSWSWTFDNTATSMLQNPVKIYSASSQHAVKLIVSNGVCQDTITKTIILDNQVIANFEVSNIICPEDSVVILNKTTGNITNWQWVFGNGSTSSQRDPLPVRYPPNGRETFYTIKLFASNPAMGCVDSVSRVIKVLSSCLIAVPTAFTPNGDGINDYLYPVNALKADNIEFSIYNRWGQQMFYTTNWQKKWNGTFNGTAQPAGTYVWYLSFIHHDTGKKVFMKGFTILIR